MSRPDSTKPTAGDGDILVIKGLQNQIRQLETERKQLQEALFNRQANLRELEELRQRLVEKDGEIQDLVTQVAELRATSVAQAPVKLPTRVDSRQVTMAIQSVYPSVQFCLDDIDSRVASTEGAPRNRDIDVVVRLFTTPSGKAYDVKASAIDYSPSVRMCIEDALARVAYPNGSETLEVRVDIAWTSGNLTMAARVVGQRESTGSGTQLDI